VTDEDNKAYWTHNTAYHKYILRYAKGRDRALDVGCGDGLLVRRLSGVCRFVTGAEPDAVSADRAMLRLKDVENAEIIKAGFEDYDAEDESFDYITFVASIHHMDLEYCLRKAKRLLKRGGALIVVGCAKSRGAGDALLDAARAIPARIGSLLHGEAKGGIGVPTETPETDLKTIKNAAKRELPGVKIRRGLYYRYLLRWTKP